MKKSIAVNALLNAIQTSMSIIFPLITFPYVSRVLGVESLGEYSYCNSIVSYFALIAGLGINTYAVREGAKYRNDPIALNEFVKEIFSINVYSTLFSYLVLVFCMLFVDELSENIVIISILSIQIGFITVGRSWIYSIFEDYFYVTIRTIVFYIVSIILLFTIVHTPQDLIKYAFVNVSGVAGANICNFIYGRKYCDYQFGLAINHHHVKAIVMIFFTTLSIVLYTNSDITLLGVLTSDRNVGLYSSSVKVYNIVKQIIAALLIVTIPRLSYYVGRKEKEQYINLFNKVLNIMLLIILPTSAGLFVVSRDVILLISGNDFLDAVFGLKILSLAIVFNLIAYMFAYCVLIPNKKEKVFLYATVISALLNIVLNVFFIPKFQQNAAAVTTLISEILAAIICCCFSREYIEIHGIRRNTILAIIGCLWICFIGMINFKTYLNNPLLHLLVVFGLSITGYSIIQIVGKNRAFFDIKTLFERDKTI